MLLLLRPKSCAAYNFAKFQNQASAQLRKQADQGTKHTTANTSKIAQIMPSRPNFPTAGQKIEDSNCRSVLPPGPSWVLTQAPSGQGDPTGTCHFLQLELSTSQTQWENICFLHSLFELTGIPTNLRIENSLTLRI